LELYPVASGAVGDGTPIATGGDVAAALAALSWPEPAAPGCDEAWLMSWLYERKRRGVYAIVEDGAAGAERLAAEVAAAVR